MNINIHDIIIADIFATLAMATMAIITIYNYQKKKFRHLFYISLLWISITAANLVVTLSNIFLSPVLYAIFFNMFPIEVLCTILFIDFATRENPDALKLIIWGFISGMLLIESNNPDSFYQGVYPGNKEVILFQGRVIEPLFLVMSLYWAFILLLFTIRTFIEAPKSLKLLSFSNIIAVILLAIRGIFSYQFYVIFPPLNTILLITAFAILMVNFIKYPQIAFILPFKVLRINVMDIHSGITIYSYDWYSKSDVKLINEVLFSSMLHGLNAILHEAVNQGNVHEIHLDRALLLLHRFPDSPVLFVLVATKTSSILRKALEFFAGEFCRQYEDAIENLKNGIHNLENFKGADQFITKCFPFVPEYRVEKKKRT